MSCCGQGRAQLRQTQKPLASTAGLPSARSQTIYFQNVGTQSLTVRGPYSNQIYQFRANGGRLAIDPRDRAALRQVAALVEVAY